MLGVRAREGNGERHSDPESDDVLTDDDDFFRRLKVPRTFYSRNSTPIIIGERTCEETRGEEDAQSEEEEGEQSEEGEEAQEDDEYQEDDDDMNVDEELTNLPLNVGDQEDHSLTSASREERGGEEEDAQSEEAEGEQDHHQSEQEVEEGQQSEEDEEYQEEDEVQEDYDDMNVGEEFINLLINVGYQEGHRSTSASREETGGEQDAQSEEVEGEQDHHQSEQEVEEGQQWEEDEVYQEDDEDHEEDDDLNVNDELNNRPHVGDQEGCSSTSSSMEGCNIVITLTDSGLLDCPICFEPLTIPVYQCDPNGHIACSLCSIKIDNKCPFCNRCRAIEKVVESSTTPCQNWKYGCNIPVTYNKKNEHEKTCVCSPCSCPYFGCKFVSSAKELYRHFSNAHLDSATSFLYDNYKIGLSFPIILKKNDSFLVFREKNSGTLFILYNLTEVLGNVVTVCCIQPSFMDAFTYVLLVTNKESSLKFQSVTKSTPSLQVDGPSPTSFLLIPCEFFDSCDQVQINVSIRSCIW